MRALAPLLLVAVALAGCSSSGAEPAAAARAVRFADVQRFVAASHAVRMTVSVRGGSSVEATVDRPGTVRTVETLEHRVVETVADGSAVHRREAVDDAEVSKRNWHEVPGATALLLGDSALARLGGPAAVWPLVAGLHDVVRTGPRSFRAVAADGRPVTLSVDRQGAPQRLSLGPTTIVVRDWGDRFAIDVPGRDVDLTPLVDEPALADFRLGPVQVPDLPAVWEAVRSAVYTYDDEPGCDSASVTYTPEGDDPGVADAELLASLVEPGCEADDYDYDIGLARPVPWGGGHVRVLDEVPAYGAYTEEGGVAVWVPTAHGTIVLSTSLHVSEATLARLVATLHPITPMVLGTTTS